MRKIAYFFWIIFISFNSSAQRNVILIIADDIGTDYFGFYDDHQDTVDVPNIRSLVNRGVRFSNAMSNPVCSSTRSGILTGRYSFRTGVGGIVGSPSGSNQLDTSEITIPRLLKIVNPNIATADIGKWHLHQPTPLSNLQNPQVLGYDHFEGPFIGALPSYTNWTKYTNGIASSVTHYATSENVDNALNWLHTVNSSNPFFLWLAFNAPHEPLHLPPANLHSFTSLSGTPADINANPKQYFKAMLQALDTEIGRLFDSLQVMNRLDSTDIIFIGDNGNTPRTAQIANLDKAKGTIYQYGIHVPFIIAGPSVISPGRVSEALINTTDIFATVLELFGYLNWQSQIPINKPVDSKSILPILKNQNNQIRPWSFCEIFKLITDSADGKAIRNEEYKLINFDYGKQEFYNLVLDSAESTNLLNGTLNTFELSNYNYLCNEMTNLIGTGTFCNANVGLEDMNFISTQPAAYPNPFHTNIQLNNKFINREVELTNYLGQIIYVGNKIEEQNFEWLSPGIYFLKNKNITNEVIKMLKND